MEAIARRGTEFSDFSPTMLRPTVAVPHFTAITETFSIVTPVRRDTPARSRRRSYIAPVINPKFPYKITLPELVHQRLRLAAMERGVNVSTLTAEILDQYLPALPADVELSSRLQSTAETSLRDF